MNTPQNKIKVQDANDKNLTLSNQKLQSTGNDRLGSLKLIENQASNQKKLQLYQELCSSGKKQMMKAILKNKLIESGWMDRMQALCNDTISEKYGLNLGNDEYIDIEGLAKELKVKGMNMISEDIKKDMEKRLSEWLDEENMRDDQ